MPARLLARPITASLSTTAACGTLAIPSACRAVTISAVVGGAAASAAVAAAAAAAVLSWCPVVCLPKGGLHGFEANGTWACGNGREDEKIECLPR